MIAIISDVHGKYSKYLEICAQYEYTIQVGDMGFNYEPILKLDPKCHKWFRGNHDNPCGNYLASNLGQFGEFELNNKKFFFISGAWSIDGDLRRIDFMRGGPKSWWQDEELNYKEMDEALELYKKCKPVVMLSHEAPLNLVQYLGTKGFAQKFGYDREVVETRTNILLQKCWDSWEPSLWVHGHFHTSKQRVIGKTKFISLGELEVYIIE